MSVANTTGVIEAPAPVPVRKSRTKGSRFLILLAVLCLAVSLGIIFTAHTMTTDVQTSGFATSKNLIRRTLDQNTFQVPANMLRFAGERSDGAASEINLVLLWPSFEGYSLDKHKPFVTHSDRNPLLFVTLTARTEAAISAELLDRVYIHDFVGATLQGETGLVGKKLDPQSGYVNETVWYDPLSPNPFTTRCYAGESADIAQSTNCMRTIALGQNVAATYRFPETLLPYWRELDSQIVANLSNLMQ